MFLQLEHSILLPFLNTGEISASFQPSGVEPVLQHVCKNYKYSKRQDIGDFL
jgi:hypothetical protein